MKFFSYRPPIRTRQQLRAHAAHLDPESDQYQQIQSALLSNDGRAFFVDPATGLKYSLLVSAEFLLGGMMDTDENDIRAEYTNLDELWETNKLLLQFIADADRVKNLSIQGNMPVVLIVGRTGTGKSTTANHLIRVDLELSTGSRKKIIRVSDDAQPHAIINHGMSDARGVNILTLDDMVLCDCPGDHDTTGRQFIILNDIAITLVARAAQSVRIVYAIPFRGTDRDVFVSLLPQFLQQAMSMYKNFLEQQNSLLLLFVNKTSEPILVTDLTDALQSAVEELRNRPIQDSSAIENLENIASSARDHLQIAEPLTPTGDPNQENREAILTTIRGLTPITDPATELNTFNPPNVIFDFLYKHLSEIIKIMRARIDQHDRCVEKNTVIRTNINDVTKNINRISESIDMVILDKQSEIAKHRESIVDTTNKIRAIERENIDLNRAIAADENALYDDFIAKEDDVIQYGDRQFIHQEPEQLSQLQLATAGMGLGAAAGALSRNGLAGFIIAVISASAAAVRGQIPICRKTFKFNNPRVPIAKIEMDPPLNDSRWRNKEGGEGKDFFEISYYCTPDQPAQACVTFFISNKHDDEFIKKRDELQKEIAAKKRKISANNDTISVSITSISAAEGTITKLSDQQLQQSKGSAKECDLCLMDELEEKNPERAKEGKLYLSGSGDYIVRDPSGKIQKGSLVGEGVDLENLAERLKDPTFKKAILKVTSKRGHTPAKLSDLMEILIELEYKRASLEKQRCEILNEFEGDMNLFASVAIIKKQIMDALCNYPDNKHIYISESIVLYEQFVQTHRLSTVPELKMPSPFPESTLSVADDTAIAPFNCSNIFSMIAVPQDANCLFHAISDQLTRINYQPLLTHIELRQRAVAYMRAHIGQYMPCIQGDSSAYFQKMANEGRWGGELEIRALEDALHLRILIIIQEGNHYHVIAPKGNASSPIIYLACNQISHYNSLVPTVNLADFSEHYKMTVLPDDGDSLLHAVSHQLLVSQQQFYPVEDLRRIIDNTSLTIANPIAKLAEQLNIYIHVVQRIGNNDVFITYGQIHNPDVYLVKLGDNYYNSLIHNRWLRNSLEQDLDDGRRLVSHQGSAPNLINSYNLNIS